MVSLYWSLGFYVGTCTLLSTWISLSVYFWISTNEFVFYQSRYLPWLSFPPQAYVEIYCHIGFVCPTTTCPTYYDGGVGKESTLSDDHTNSASIQIHSEYFLLDWCEKPSLTDSDLTQLNPFKVCLFKCSHNQVM